MTQARQYSKSQIEWLVGRRHVSETDAEITALILARATDWPKAQAELAVADALKAHHRNQKLCRAVTDGQWDRAFDTRP